MMMGDALSSLEELSPGLTHAQLRARLTKVLQFAINNLEELDRHAKFWQEEETPAQKETPAVVSPADKVVVETALLGLLASRVYADTDPGKEVLDSLVERLGARARTERNQVLLLRFPYTAASLGISHIALSRMGHGDEGFDFLLRNALASGHAEALERLPYREMDYRWLLGILDPHASPEFDDLLPQSILTSCAHPIYMSEIDAYSITHALMYLTDFGSHKLPSSLAPDRLSAMVDSCLAWDILGCNLDLLGEFLMSAALVPGLWSPYARMAWQVLTLVWDEFGFLPSSSFDSARYRSLPGDEASAYAFLHVYHTTYVAGILCALLLRHPERCDSARAWKANTQVDPSLLDRADCALRAARNFCAHDRTGQPQPPDGVDNPLAAPSDGPVPGRLVLEQTIAHLGEYPGPCGRPGAPWAEAAANTPLQPGELALVLNDALLISAARDYKLPVLVAALLDRAGSDLPLSPTLLEAMAFLIRQQVRSGAIGAHFVVTDNCESAEARSITVAIADCIARLVPYVSAASQSLSAGGRPRA